MYSVEPKMRFQSLRYKIKPAGNLKTKVQIQKQQISLLRMKKFGNFKAWFSASISNEVKSQWGE